MRHLLLMGLGDVVSFFRTAGFDANADGEDLWLSRNGDAAWFRATRLGSRPWLVWSLTGEPFGPLDDLEHLRREADYAFPET